MDYKKLIEDLQDTKKLQIGMWHEENEKIIDQSIIAISDLLSRVEVAEKRAKNAEISLSRFLYEEETEPSQIETVEANLLVHDYEFEIPFPGGFWEDILMNKLTKNISKFAKLEKTKIGSDLTAYTATVKVVKE